MSAFLTGSRVYGKPTADSDYDLVVLVSPADLRLLQRAHERAAATAEEGAEPPYEGTQSLSLRFGPLNVLAFCKEDLFNAWRDTTALLKKRKPVKREDAVVAFKVAMAATLALRPPASTEAMLGALEHNQ